jgi:hypothetical protein
LVWALGRVCNSGEPRIMLKHLGFVVSTLGGWVEIIRSARG